MRNKFRTTGAINTYIFKRKTPPKTLGGVCIKRSKSMIYLANDTARFSRMTVTFICPGYCIVSWIF